MEGNSALTAGITSAWAGWALLLVGIFNLPFSVGQRLPLNDHTAGTAVIAGVSLIVIGTFLFMNGFRDAYTNT